VGFPANPTFQRTHPLVALAGFAKASDEGPSATETGLVSAQAGCYGSTIRANRHAGRATDDWNAGDIALTRPADGAHNFEAHLRVSIIDVLDWQTAKQCLALTLPWLAFSVLS
jgi:hypothetical protein